MAKWPGAAGFPFPPMIVAKYQYRFVRAEDVIDATDQVLPNGDNLRYQFEMEIENPNTSEERKVKLRDIQWTPERNVLVKRRVQ